MKLTIKDRLSLMFLYPRESTIVSQILVKDIRSKTDITQEEKGKIDLRSLPNGSITWDEDKAKTVIIDVEFTDPELELLKTQITILDRSKKITQNMVELCLKIKKLEPKKS